MHSVKKRVIFELLALKEELASFKLIRLDFIK